MIRNVFAVVSGFMLSIFIQGWFRILSSKLYPLTENIDPSNWESMKEFHANLPNSAFLLESFSFSLSAFIAAWITAKIAASQKFNLGVLTGIIVFISTIILLFSIPNPIWVVVLDICLVILCVYLGARLGAGGVPDYDL